MTTTENATETTTIEAAPGDGTALETATTDDDLDTATTETGEIDEDTAETFPRSVVERLRQENAKYRQRAQQADDLAGRLHTELVRATGRLADPTDLPFDPTHLDDADALAGAIDELLTAKPHLALRRVTGDVGQGNRGHAGGTFSLIDTLKGLT